MKQDYIDLINKIKQKQQDREEQKGLNENAKKLINAILSEPLNDMIKEENEKKALDNVIYMKEYKKEDVVFGVVCIKKDIIKNIDLGEKYEMYYENETVYDSYIIMIDKENELDHIMFKRTEKKKEGLEYAESLSSIIEENNLDYIVKFISESI